MEGFLLIVVIYVVLTVLGAMQKQKRQERERALRSRGAGRPETHAEQMSGLQQALEELRRAEMEAKRLQAPAPEGHELLAFPPRQQARRVLDLEEAEAEPEEVAEESVEEIHEVEAIDLEEQGAREVEARYRANVEEAAAVVARVEMPEPPRIVARVTPSIAPAPSVVPDEKLEGVLAPRARRRPPLARWGRGSARDAVVLAEILQRPVGERM